MYYRNGKEMLFLGNFCYPYPKRKQDDGDERDEDELLLMKHAM